MGLNEINAYYQISDEISINNFRRNGNIQSDLGYAPKSYAVYHVRAKTLDAKVGDLWGSMEHNSECALEFSPYHLIVKRPRGYDKNRWNYVRAKNSSN